MLKPVRHLKICLQGALRNSGEDSYPSSPLFCSMRLPNGSTTDNPLKYEMKSVRILILKNICKYKRLSNIISIKNSYLINISPKLRSKIVLYLSSLLCSLPGPSHIFQVRSNTLS